MERGRYQQQKHRRVNSVQKPTERPTQEINHISYIKSNNYTPNLIKKKSNQIQEVETASSFFPNVSCKSGCVFDIDNQQFIWKCNSTQKREIASLTKIMTCWMTIQYIRANKIVPQNEYFVVSKKAAQIGGTSAELCEGDQISIWDLLHGLMLPSGNDAAICLAEGIGKSLIDDKKNPIESFVDQMNKQAAKYRMMDTVYVNPHGLSNRNHKSTVQDQALLIKQVLKDSIFRILIEKKIYFCNVEQKNKWSREMFWETTNKLLHHGFNGIKTGSTPQAGACLASWYNRQGHNVIIVTLSSNSNDERFLDSLNIVKWLKNKAIVADYENQQFD